MSFTVLQYLVICYLPFNTLLLTTEPLPRFCPFLKCHNLTSGSMRGRQETKSLKLVLTSTHNWDFVSSLLHCIVNMTLHEAVDCGSTSYIDCDLIQLCIHCVLFDLITITSDSDVPFYCHLRCLYNDYTLSHAYITLINATKWTEETETWKIVNFYVKIHLIKNMSLIAAGDFFWACCEGQIFLVVLCLMRKLYT